MGAAASIVEVPEDANQTSFQGPIPEILIKKLPEVRMWRYICHVMFDIWFHLKCFWSIYFLILYILWAQAIEESVYVHEKFPLIIDPTGKAKMFLKYQTGSFITQHEFSNKELINRCLAGCIIHVSSRVKRSYYDKLSTHL